MKQNHLRKILLSFEWILCGFLMLMSIDVFADELRVDLDNRQISVDDTVSLQYFITSQSSRSSVGQPKYEAPDFEEVNSFKGSSSFSTTIINGQMSTERQEQYVVVLHPKKTGHLKISKISITIDQKEYKAEDQSVDVSKQGQMPPAQGNLSSGRKDLGRGKSSSLIIIPEVNVRDVFDHQGIVVQYSLYTKYRQSVQITKQPVFKGAYTESLPLGNSPQCQPVNRNGENYQRCALAKMYVVPLKPGRLDLAPLETQIEYEVPLGRGGRQLDDEDDPFGLNQFFGRTARYQEKRSSESEFLQVQPVPDHQGFSGLVGTFHLEGGFDRKTVSVGQSIQLSVKLSGAGYAGVLEKLPIEWPQDFEIYEDKANTKLLNSEESLREFRLVLVPKAAGTFTLKPLELVTFKPESREFVTLRLDLGSLQILPGAGGAAAGSGPGLSHVDTSTQPKPESVVQPTTLDGIKPLNHSGSWWWFLHLLQIICCGGALFFLVKLIQRRLVPWWKALQSHKKSTRFLAKNELQRMLSLPDEVPLRLQDLRKVLYQHVLETYGFDLNQSSLPESQEAQLQDLEKLLEILNLAEYAPGDEVLIKTRQKELKQSLKQYLSSTEVLAK